MNKWSVESNMRELEKMLKDPKIPEDVKSTVQSMNKDSMQLLNDYYNSSYFSSNESDTYFKNIIPNATFLYSAASILPRNFSAAYDNFSSNPKAEFEKKNPINRGTTRLIVGENELTGKY